MNKQNKQTKPEKCYAVPGQAAYIDTWCNNLVADGAHSCAEIEKVYPTFCTTNPPSSPTAPATPVPSPTAEIPTYNCLTVSTTESGYQQRYLKKMDKGEVPGTISHEQFTNSDTKCNPFKLTCSLIKGMGCIPQLQTPTIAPLISKEDAINSATTCKTRCAPNAVCPKPVYIKWKAPDHPTNYTYGGACTVSHSGGSYSCYQVETSSQDNNKGMDVKQGKEISQVCCSKEYNKDMDAWAVVHPFKQLTVIGAVSSLNSCKSLGLSSTPPIAEATTEAVVAAATAL
jgi:hypothetical protein